MLSSQTLSNTEDAIKFNVLGLNSFVVTVAYAASAKIQLSLLNVEGHMRNEEVSPFPSCWIFLFLDIFGLFQTPETGLSNLNISR